jgi:hypothetical protein
MSNRPTLDDMQMFRRRVAKEWLTRAQAIDYSRASPNELAVIAGNLASSLGSLLTVIDEIAEVPQ